MIQKNPSIEGFYLRGQKMEIKKGCLIEAFKNSDVQAIIHQANCFKTMGSGIAKAIRLKLGDAYLADVNFQKKPHERLGDFSFAIINSKIVFNAYGQFECGATPDTKDRYVPLEQSLKKIAEYLDGSDLSKKDGFKIGIPMIGCGIAGGDWGVVSKIVEKTLSNYDVVLYVL